jgi:hypothetical protein
VRRQFRPCSFAGKALERRPRSRAFTPVNVPNGRGHSSAGRALAWHARGQRFDPAWLHQSTSEIPVAIVTRRSALCASMAKRAPAFASLLGARHCQNFPTEAPLNQNYLGLERPLGSGVNIRHQFRPPPQDFDPVGAMPICVAQAFDATDCQRFPNNFRTFSRYTLPRLPGCSRTFRLTPAPS